MIVVYNTIISAEAQRKNDKCSIITIFLPIREGCLERNKYKPYKKWRIGNGYCLYDKIVLKELMGEPVLYPNVQASTIIGM